MNMQLMINYRHRVSGGNYFTGAGRVINRGRSITRMFWQFIIGLDMRSGVKLFGDEIFQCWLAAIFRDSFTASTAT